MPLEAVLTRHAETCYDRPSVHLHRTCDSICLSDIKATVLPPPLSSTPIASLLRLCLSSQSDVREERGEEDCGSKRRQVRSRFPAFMFLGCSSALPLKPTRHVLDVAVEARNLVAAARRRPTRVASGKGQEQQLQRLAPAALRRRQRFQPSCLEGERLQPGLVVTRVTGRAGTQRAPPPPKRSCACCQG